MKALQETVQSEVKSVQSEMKTFSSVLQQEIKSQSTEVKNNFASVISVKKVGDAVKQVVEKECKGRNVIIYGAPETENQLLESQVENIFELVGQKPRIVDCCRLGRVGDGVRAKRPVKVSLSNSAIVSDILRNCKMLRNDKEYRNIFICPDRTIEQRRTQKGLVENLKKLKIENPGARYRIRGGKVEQCENLVP